MALDPILTIAAIGLFSTAFWVGHDNLWIGFCYAALGLICVLVDRLMDFFSRRP